MNGYALPRPYANPVRTWALASLFIAGGFLAFVIDILNWPASPFLWLGLLELALGTCLMYLVFVVARAHSPVALRVGVGLLAIFVVLFLTNLALVAVRG